MLDTNATACALSLLRNRFDPYKSLNGEDIILMATLVSAAKGHRGTFVELGAFTGQHSNTAILERCFGWSGLLIEANPSNFAQLQAKAHRPRSRKVHSAVCGAEGINGKKSVRFTQKGGSVAGQVDMLTEQHQKDWGRLNKPSQSVEVPCQPLERIMADNGLADGATFLSLDVEGSEELVLSTVRPSAFHIIMVETDATELAKDQRVERRILDDGLRLQPMLTRQIYNSSHVYTRPSVIVYPLPDKWTKPGRLLGRTRIGDRVNSTLLLRLLTHAAHGTELAPDLFLK